MTDEDVREVLTHGTLDIEGRLAGSSNATFLAQCSVQGLSLEVVYKPRRGERPLWDFAEGTLSKREVAAANLDHALGWGYVPPTVWRETGPYGAGSCQRWVTIDHDNPPIDVLPQKDIPSGWRSVAQGEGESGELLYLVHEDSPHLQRIAVFDVIANNADRKGGHVLRDQSGGLVAIDHGLTFHTEAKLRTVLWGWSGDAISGEILSDLRRLQALLDADPDGLIGDLVTRSETAALHERVHELTARGRLPEHAGAWPALPWPVM